VPLLFVAHCLPLFFKLANNILRVFPTKKIPSLGTGKPPLKSPTPKKNKKYYYDNEAIKEPAKDWGTRDRTKGKYHNEGTGLQPHSGLTKSYPTKNKRSVWSVTNKPYREAHFATYPPDLIEPCIKAGSQEGDLILDPFMGSGTTAMVAKSLGRDYIGCELHEDYGSLIQKRVQDYVPQKEVSQEPCINILDIL